jgi:hypothetical protein
MAEQTVTAAARAALMLSERSQQEHFDLAMNHQSSA